MNDASGNNVWDSIAQLGSQSVAAYADITKARYATDAAIARDNANAFTAVNARTNASPSGFLDMFRPNIPPGQASSYPQNDGKPTPGGTPSVSATLFSSAATGLGSQLMIGVFIALIVAAVVALVRR